MVTLAMVIDKDPIAAGPKTQTWPSVAAWPRMSSWLQVATPATQISLPHPHSVSMVSGTQSGPRYQPRPQTYGWSLVPTHTTAISTDHCRAMDPDITITTGSCAGSSDPPIVVSLVLSHHSTQTAWLCFLSHFFTLYSLCPISYFLIVVCS